MAKKKRGGLRHEIPMKLENKLPNIKKSEETYQMLNRRVVGLKKPNINSSSSRYLYNDGGMAFDRFEYGLD